ncbi:MAG: hypothetical protein H7067_06910, partial [Burkholderiales bacterium]|nr:hypothetical protein [Opitutaceae bacterium]
MLTALKNVPARTPRALSTFVALSSLLAFTSAARAKIVAATDFDGTASVPNVTWTPELALGVGVPASAASYAALNNNGTVDVRTNTGVKPVPVGAKTKSMSMNADFTGVSSG